MFSSCTFIDVSLIFFTVELLTVPSLKWLNIPASIANVDILSVMLLII